jgi:membrane-associated phospholipid phosphatase
LLAVIPPLLWLWPAPSRRRAANQRVAASAVLSVAIAVAVAWVIGHLYFESRPFVKDGSTRLLVQHGADNSFPSDHVTFAAAIAGALLAARPHLGLGALTAAVAISVSRVFVGVHWPDDVVAGMAIGLGAGLLAIRAERLWVRPQRAFSRVLPSLLISPP